MSSGKGERVYAAPGLHGLEDVSTILLLRTLHACRLVFGRNRGRIPPLWAKRFTDGAVRRWQVHADGSIHLAGKRDISLAPGIGTNPAAHAGSTLRAFNYGRLELFHNLPHSATTPAAVDGAATIHFAGPGDIARFRFPPSQAGSLIIERIPGNMPWLSIRIGLSENTLESRGMIDIPAGGQALVELGYNGFGPARMDVGFLFTPDIPVQCRVNIEHEKDGMIRAHLELTNISGEAVSIPQPSAGTVDWLADSEIVAAARLGRKPSIMILAAGERLDYEVQLNVPDEQAPTAARVELGERYGAILCKRAGM